MPVTKNPELPVLEARPAPAVTETGRRPGPSPVPADRELARECFERIRELSRSKDERISLAACKEIIDRVHGKPEQAHRLEAEGAGVVVVIREGRDGGSD